MGRPISLFQKRSKLHAIYLVLRRERELNSLVGELGVDGGEGLELVLSLGKVLLGKEDLEELGLIETNTGALTDDLGREDQILKDSVVDSGHGTRTRAADTGLLAVL